MPSKTKRYYVVIRGNVQDVGYRKRIESAAGLFNIIGFPWNDVDGSVKIVCEGEESYVNRFLEEIEIKEELPSGVFVETLERKKISVEFPLPPKFAKLETEELAEISGKLDAGVGRLKGIEVNTATMGESLKSMDSGLKSMDSELKSMDSELKGINSGLKSMDSELKGINSGLKSIDSKLDTLPERIARAIK